MSEENQVGTRIGKNIKLIMDRSGITPSQLATSIDKSLPTVSRILNGSPSINWDVLNNIAETLGVGMGMLVESGKEMISLTGIKSIDDAIVLINACLYSGKKGYQRCSHLFSPNYKLIYADVPLGSENRVFKGTAEDEFDVNNPVANSEIRSASIVNESVQVCTAISRLTNKIDRQNEMIPGVYKFHIETLTIIDTYTFNRPIEKIIQGRPFQITSRHLQVVDAKRESI